MIDFIGVGVQKSGTTWLYSRLSELPEFSLTPEKEIHYFDRDIKYPSPDNLSERSLLKRMISYNWLFEAFDITIQQLMRKDVNAFKWYLKYYFSNYNDDWYRSLFSNLPGIKGEITPSYSILQVEDISRMRTIAPNAKLVLLLRNPVDRAWSHFRHKNRNNKNFDVDDFSIDQIIAFIESDPQEMRSDYITTISNFKKAYPKSQLLIGFYDAIIENPNQLLFEIVNFIGGRTNDIDKFCKLNRVDNASKKAVIPIEVNEYLKSKYKEMVQDLSDTYGAYFTCWYNDLYVDKVTGNKDRQNTSTTFVP